MSNIDLAVIIPAYNEEEIIGTVINDWVNCLGQLDSIHYQIHVYNDGSKDNTLSELYHAAEGKTGVVVHDKPNSGHGPTILQGYNENMMATWLLQIDSDNEISSGYFPGLWNDRHNYDFLIGYRKHQNRPPTRKIISWFSKTWVALLFGKGIHDVNVPYRLMRTSAFAPYVKSIPLDTFAPNVIISGIAARENFRIKQQPVTCTGRQTGEVSIKRFKLLKFAFISYLQTLKFAFKANKVTK